MKKSLLLVLFMFVFLGCEEEQTTETEDPRSKAFHDAAFLEVENEEYSVLGVHENGSSISIQTDYSGNKALSAVFIASEGSPGLFVEIDDQGFPQKAYINGNTILFDNFTDGTVDLAIIRANGEIEVLREINIDYPTPLTKQQYNLAKIEDISLADALRWGGHALSIAGCAISVAATVGTVGALAPLTVIGCGAVIIGIAVEFIPDDNPALEASGAALGAFSSAAGCMTGNALSCAAWFANSAGALATIAEEAEEENQDEVDLAGSALEHGYGDVQVTLTWDNTADLDLLVTDPNDETIYFGNEISSSGGQLDIDDMNGYGPENIYWATDQAPTGTYKVYVHHYGGSSPSNYSILINAFGTVNTYSGSISSSQTLAITEFSSSGLAKANMTITEIRSLGINPKKEVK